MIDNRINGFMVKSKWQCWAALKRSIYCLAAYAYGSSIIFSLDADCNYLVGVRRAFRVCSQLVRITGDAWFYASCHDWRRSAYNAMVLARSYCGRISCRVLCLWLAFHAEAIFRHSYAGRYFGHSSSLHHRLAFTDLFVSRSWFCELV